MFSTRKIVILFVILFAFLVIFFFKKEFLFGAISYPRAWVPGLITTNELAVKEVSKLKAELKTESEPENNLVVVTTVPENVPSKVDQTNDLIVKIDALQAELATQLALENPAPQKAPEPLPVEVSNSSTYPRLLISEVEIGGINDEQQEFVELYNPGEQPVDLSGWYVQRKTKTSASFSTFAASTLFLGKIIYAHGYIVIARQGFGAGMVDIFVDKPLTDDNTLVLKNPAGEISDKLGWGLAEDKDGLPAPNPIPGQSIGRSENEMDSDNNATDFVLDFLTPHEKNRIYVAPLVSVETVNGGGGGSAPSPELAQITISEVQAEGQTVKDEFVKLYNAGDKVVDLTGFTLKKKTASGTESNLVGKGAFLGSIASHSYFLIAPQANEDGTENYTGTIAPDLRYSGKTFSIAFTNTVLLYDNENRLLHELLVVEPVALPVESPVKSPVAVPTPTPPVLTTTPPVFTSVIINEIAWMGTLISPNNEWIELFNSGIEAVDLTGWKLVATDGTPNITLSGNIGAGGFYLLERTDDTSVPDVTADQIYTGALGNGGENFSLSDASGKVIDQVNAVTGWPAGDNITKQTMQRVGGGWQSSTAPGGNTKL